MQKSGLIWNLQTTQKKYQKFLIVFFINVAKDISDENKNIDKSHPSIIKIEENKTDDIELSFRLTEEHVNKQISKLNIKKATGYDSRNQG